MNSVAFSTHPDNIDLHVGEHLRDMTGEVENVKITCFVTRGPQNYAYKVESDKKINLFPK